MSAIPSWCRVGAKVVYLGAVNPSPNHKRLSAGAVYVIRSIMQNPDTGTWGVRVEGVQNIIHDRLRLELGYNVSRFRPVHTLEDDITTYFAGLLDVREPVGA